MSDKLNSMRLLEKHNIPYEVLIYEPVTRDAEEVAELIGVPPFMVYKTLVIQSAETAKPALVLIPSDCQLDLKRMAGSMGEKKVRMATHADAEKLTGLRVGGISPLALADKGWPVYLDKSASELQNIVLSAGQKGVQVRVPVLPLLSLLRARLVDVAAPAD
ncbi:MAG: YbaK/EbsC family protein [Anaerolineae bacterium]|nr:YbaK/EbsC family protein [Anaerolineae bacterium]